MAISCPGLRLSFQFICYLLTIVHLVSRNRVVTDRNLRFHMSALCRERYTPLSVKVDGAVITSTRDENMNCTLTFQTEKVSQRFMLRFDDLRLDCNDHLYIYDGDGSAGPTKVHLTCRSTRDDMGKIVLGSNYVTLKYQTDHWSQAGDGFTLVITATRDAPNCPTYKCQYNNYCISTDLLCDGVDHCGDKSDETHHANCYYEEDTGSIFGLPVHVFIVTVGAVFLTCLVCVIGLAIYLCKREQQMYQAQQQRISSYHHQLGTSILAHPASYTGSMNATLSPPSQRFATLPLPKRGDKSPPPYSGSVVNNLSSHHIMGNMNANTPTTPALQQIVYYSPK
ncbi:uncharacterized protein LOC141858338 isoform X1 [Brevipalpus obovatus]|uniref:uncharacterized protein LOC141858338 isoform X1 n=1 Tax=Brevipalpus obovatus TaxID=246614 RepID=UPI003D9DB9FC